MPCKNVDGTLVLRPYLKCTFSIFSTFHILQLGPFRSLFT